MKKTFFTCSMAFALLFCWILFSNINPSLASDTIRVGIVTGLTGWGADLGGEDERHCRI